MALYIVAIHHPSQGTQIVSGPSAIVAASSPEVQFVTADSISAAAHKVSPQTRAVADRIEVYPLEDPITFENELRQV